MSWYIAHGIWHDTWVTVSRLVGEVWPISRSAAARTQSWPSELRSVASVDGGTDNLDQNLGRIRERSRRFNGSPTFT